LDWLRNGLGPLYEQQAKQYCDDPWALRNAYIQVVNDRHRGNVDQFLNAAARKTLAPADKTQLLKLLEMQRHAMLMYTSCAWFFDDISGLEAVQILQYACRAMQLAQQVSDTDFEPDFIEMLEQAPCNAHAYAHGKDLYQQRVKPCSVDLDRVGAHLALSTLFDPVSDKGQVYCYSSRIETYDRQEAGARILATGRARISSDIVWESRSLDFAVVHHGDRNLTGAVHTRLEDPVFTSLQTKLSAAFERGDSAEMLRVMKAVLPGKVYSIQHVFRDEQRRLLDHLMQDTWQDIGASFCQIYEQNIQIMQLMRKANIPLPQALAAPAAFTVNQELRRLIQADSIDATRVQALLDESTCLGIGLDYDGLRYEAGRKLNACMEQLEKKPNSLCLLQVAESTLRALVGLCDPLDLHRAQAILFGISKHEVQNNTEQTDTGEGAAAQRRKLLGSLAQHLDVVIASFGE